MFKNMSSLFTSTCEVVEINQNLIVYPIFKNGRSSITSYAEKNKLKIYRNSDIKKIKVITVFLRPAVERFVSGVNTFFYLNGLQEIDEDMLKNIELKKLTNIHFFPQYLWLLHLYRYFRGSVVVREVKDVYDLIPLRHGPWTGGPPWTPLTDDKKSKILSIDHNPYTAQDIILLKKYMNQTVLLETIINDREIRNALS